MSTLAQRYWRALIGIPQADRAFQGYGLWQRYWTSLLGIRLPARDTVHRQPAPGNPLTRPDVAGTRIRFPRFDPAAVRLAATEEVERASVRWTAAGRRFTIRESGPGEIDLLVESEQEIPATQVLPVGVTTVAGHRRYLMVFVPDTTGGSIGALRLAGTSGWLDVTVDEELPAAALDAGGIAESVAATPDPGMAAWAEIAASRPAGDPLRQVIEDAAG